MNTIIDWIQTTALNSWILETAWAWVLFETLHFFGVCILLGALLVIDLRLIGFFRNLSIHATHKLLPWVFIGFGINLITGILFLIGDPVRYSSNMGFRIKMLLVFLAGLNALWFFIKLDKPMQGWSSHSDTPFNAKVIGCLSLILWFGVLILGRMIPYVSTG